MPKTNFLLQKIAFLKEIFNEKFFKGEMIGAILYLIFKPLLTFPKRKALKRQQLYSYKLLDRIRFRGKALLLSVAFHEFLLDFETWLGKSDSYKSKHRLHVRIDRSDTGDHYGKNIPALQKVYDTSKGYSKRSHVIECLLVSLGKKDYVLDFNILCEDEKGYTSTFLMLHELLLRLGHHRDNFRRYCRLSLDGWYGKGKLFEYLQELGLTRSVLKSGGIDNVLYKNKEYTLTGLKKHLMNKGEYRDFNPCHGFENCDYKECIVELMNKQIKLKAVLVRYHLKAPFQSRYLLLLSPNLEWWAYQIVQCYKARWQIEVMFRTSKQVLELKKKSYHTKDANPEPAKLKKKQNKIETHLALNLIGYMIINWCRIECTRMSRTSLDDIKLSWMKLFEGYSPKALQCLFSSYG